MTAISAATSISSYSYPYSYSYSNSYGKSSTAASQGIPSSNTVSATKSTASRQLDDDTSSAQKLMSQLTAMAMNRFAQEESGIVFAGTRSGHVGGDGRTDHRCNLENCAKPMCKIA
ncbi:hypothetical protein A4U53_037065 (plasmid) [Rhizobium ruizarguesonis]|uniref:Uncharacterized protein n=2 Tax=Rhizobium TaxID=379 RepID=A0A179BKP9_RHILE|nr:hypothetical protein A4U53_03300 [Rhizobium leguminosarum]